MNRKHKVHNCDKCSAQFKTSMKLVKHMAESQERGKTDQSYCDDCGFSCKTKKNLRAHKYKSHFKRQFFKCGYKFESEIDMNYIFTKRHTNNIDPFIVKRAYDKLLGFAMAD